MKIYLPILKWLVSLGNKAETDPAIYAHGGVQPVIPSETNNLDIPHKIPVSLSEIHGKRFMYEIDGETRIFTAYVIIPQNPVDAEHSSILIDYEDESKESEAMTIDAFISEVIQGAWIQC